MIIGDEMVLFSIICKKRIESEIYLRYYKNLGIYF